MGVEVMPVATTGAPDLEPASRHPGSARHPGAVQLVGLGALLGLAWAAGLRGVMAEVAGYTSTVDWVLTFGFILLPGTLTGALLGWAEHRRRTGRPTGWLVLSPLAFGVIVFSDPADPLAMLGDLLAAFVVVLYGVAGGYAISGRGPVWGRALCGALAVAPVPVWALTVTSFAPRLALDTARGAWVAVHVASLLAIFVLACAIPFRSRPS
jgi:hypothetical protein